MTVYIFDVISDISDRQVSEKKPIYVFECMAIVQSMLLEINAPKMPLNVYEKYTLRGIRHILILTKEYLLYK